MYGYSHDFCNWRVRESQSLFSFIVHNYFDFGFCFMLRVFRVFGLGTNEINIGKNGLSQVNFADLYFQMKIVITIEYF